MTNLESRLMAEHEYVYRCYCPYCGEPHSYWVGDAPPAAGMIIKAKNIVHLDGLPGAAWHEKTCTGRVPGKIWYLWQIDCMERIKRPEQP